MDPSALELIQLAWQGEPEIRMPRTMLQTISGIPVDRGRGSWSWIAVVDDRDRGSWSWIRDHQDRGRGSWSWIRTLVSESLCPRSVSAVVVVDRGREIHRCDRGRRPAMSKIQQAWKIRSWSWISLVELNIPTISAGAWAGLRAGDDGDDGSGDGRS